MKLYSKWKKLGIHPIEVLILLSVIALFMHSIYVIINDYSSDFSSNRTPDSGYSSHANLTVHCTNDDSVLIETTALSVSLTGDICKEEGENFRLNYKKTKIKSYDNNNLTTFTNFKSRLSSVLTDHGISLTQSI